MLKLPVILFIIKVNDWLNKSKRCQTNKSKHETLSGKGYFDCSSFTKAINFLNSTPQALYWFSLMHVCYIYVGEAKSDGRARCGLIISAR